MHPSNGIKMAFVSFICFVPGILGNPVPFPPRPPTLKLRMAPATIVDIGADHAFAVPGNINSSLSFDNETGLGKRGIATKLQKIRCGINGGGLANYDEGRKRFGRFMSDLGSVTLSGVRFALQNALCNDDTCDMIIGASFEVPGWLLAGQVEHFFDRAFDDVRQECKEKGGSAELIADNPKASDVCGIPTCTADGRMGLRVGTFEAQFYVHDGGDTCPAPTAQQVCKVEQFS
ncbi:hypothetical protein KVR01_011984 [Diaporthe batatas]|uniref:uncharacterized protein n=1 Tax=Diaporthe batatas TaxID=748121 RepID=UPI001D057CE0|nr:uncharacterized protein KVR01_011984 [Diaporthe batatas]KAG8158223.1 hypothetical protein KVR01_011984 [Diaporthe batatas]